MASDSTLHILQSLDQTYQNARASLQTEIQETIRYCNELRKQTEQELKQSREEHTKQLDLQKQQMLEEVESQRKAWEEIVDKARKISISQQTKIRLNIGGKHFMTTIETLTHEKHTFFSALFSDHFNTQPDKDGEIFIDRDGKFFSLILNHMRGMDVLPMIQSLSNEQRKMLMQEVDFYQIESLQRLLGIRKPAYISWGLDLEHCHSALRIAHNPHDASINIKNTESGRACVLGDTGFAAGVHSWDVRIEDARSQNNWICLGVCVREKLVPFIAGDPIFTSEAKVFGVTHTGYVSICGRNSKHEGAASWAIGSIVKVTLDCDNGKLEVGDITIEVPIGQVLYPVFCLREVNDSITLMATS